MIYLGNKLSAVIGQRIIMRNSNYRDMVKGSRKVHINYWACIFLWQRLSSPHSALGPMNMAINKSISVSWNNNKKRYFLVNLMILLLIIWILWASYILKYFCQMKVGFIICSNHFPIRCALHYSWGRDQEFCRQICFWHGFIGSMSLLD